MKTIASVLGRTACFPPMLFLEQVTNTRFSMKKENASIPVKDILIGEHVWIGYGATILKGSSLENNSTVGTESVVTGLHLPPNSVAAGNPARIIKYGVNWER